MTLKILKQTLRLALLTGASVYPTTFAATYGVRVESVMRVAADLREEGSLRLNGSYLVFGARGQVIPYPVYVPTAMLMAEMPVQDRLRMYIRSKDDLLDEISEPTEHDAWIERNFDGGSL